MVLWSRIKRSPLGSLSAWRKVVYPLMVVMFLSMLGLSIYEIYVQEAGPDASAYIGVPPDNGDLPPADWYGGFLRLKPGADTRFPSNMIDLFETNQPGVVSDDKALYVDGAAIDAVLINATVIGDPTQYRVYAIGKEPQETTTRLLGGGRVLAIQPTSGLWAPGSYIVDAPSGGMFDTSRVYYAFSIK